MADKAAEPTLQELYSAHKGKVSDKWSLYLAEYNRIFAEYRSAPVRLLEIGTQNGGSLEIWPRFFPNAQCIVGCDIDPLCGHLRFEDARVKLVVGNANSDAAQAAVLALSPDFDIVVDDGSHRSLDIVQSFARYFPSLTDGGCFVVEDLHCSYWKSFGGGLYAPHSSIAFLKRLADIVNHEHWGVKKAVSEPLEGFFEAFDCRIDAGALFQIHSIEFLNSLCVIRKRGREKNVLGLRFVAGSVEAVALGARALHLTNAATPDQEENEWSTRDEPPDRALANLQSELIDRNAQLEQRQRYIERCNECIKVLRRLQNRWSVLQAASAAKDEQIVALTVSIDDKDREMGERDARLAQFEQSWVEQGRRVRELLDLIADRDAKIGVADRALADRDGQIEGLGQSLNELMLRTTALDKTVAERESKVGSLDLALMEKEGQCRALRRDLTQCDGRLDRVQDVLHERERWIADLGRSVGRRDQAISVLEQTVTDRDKAVVDLGLTLAQSERQLASVHQAIAVRDARIGSLVSSRLESNSRIADLTRALAESQVRIDHLDQEVTDLEGLTQVLRFEAEESGERLRRLDEELVAGRARIEELHQALGRRTEEGVALQRVVARRNVQISEINRALADAMGGGWLGRFKGVFE